MGNFKTILLKSHRTTLIHINNAKIFKSFGLKFLVFCFQTMYPGFKSGSRIYLLHAYRHKRNLLQNTTVIHVYGYRDPSLCIV